MADDLQDIGSFPIFPLTPNWGRNPGSTISLPRRILSFPGTSHEIHTISSSVPIGFNATFTTVNKQEEYDLLDFFESRKGRNERFWIEFPKIAQELITAANTGSLALVCAPNVSEGLYQGYERIFIVMSNGDLLTRHVTNASLNEVTQEMTLEIATALDRDLTLANHVIIGRFLLARYDEDNLSVRHRSENISECTVRFFELVEEYSEV